MVELRTGFSILSRRSLSYSFLGLTRTGYSMLELQHRIHNGVLVLKPHKRMDYLTAPSFEEQSVAFLANGHNKIVVDCSALDYLSSAGLRVLLILAKKAKSAGGAMVFCSAGNTVKDVLEVSGFGSLLGIYTGAEEACAVLSRPV
jgi:anti-anti-sigma factor